MRSKNTFPKATFESAWALIQENAESLRVMTEKSEREIKAMKIVNSKI